MLVVIFVVICSLLAGCKKCLESHLHFKEFLAGPLKFGCILLFFPWSLMIESMHDMFMFKDFL